MKGRIALSAAIGLVVIGTVSANAGNNPRPLGSAPAIDGDGSYLVGRDIRPGTYRTTGNTAGRCHWERAKDASGRAGSLLAHATVTGTGYVTVDATDKLFTSSGCGKWEAVGTKATGSPGAPPGSRIDGDGGMYRAGRDIRPGTYRTTGNTAGRCHWERAKDALHSPGSVVAHGTATGSAVVTISAGDAYFTTSGCRDWTRTS